MKQRWIIIIGVLAVHGHAQEKPDRPGFDVGNFVRGALTVQVIGEDQQAIEGADVHIDFSNVTEYQDGYNSFRGKTGKDGLFGGESNLTGLPLIQAKKEDYYPSEIYYEFPGELNHRIKAGDRVQPWNPTIPIILKKIGKPMPLIVRIDGGTDETHWAPRVGEEMGFDLLVGDWVKPHGKGVHPDLLAFFGSQYQDINNFFVTLRLKCAHSDDGLIPIMELPGEENLLKYPRSAPEDGYVLKEIESLSSGGQFWREEHRPQEGRPLGYFFRIRTEKEPGTGRILSAQYGKITAYDPGAGRREVLRVTAFMWKNRKLDTTPGMSFDYYLNPTPNDRNLEYDQKNNLAPEWEGGDYGAAP